MSKASPKKGQPEHHHTPEERIAVATAICEMYAEDKYTIASCCKKHGISEPTFRKWRSEVTEVADLYKKAKRSAIDTRKERIQEKAITGLEKLISGFKATETTTEPIINRKGEAVLGPDGKPLEKVKKSIKVFGPNPTAVIFALKNTDPEHWKDKQEIAAEVEVKQHDFSQFSYEQLYELKYGRKPTPIR